ncbi:MAG: hypothetical protein KGZ66_08355 [Selenomonadales bacterium]|nr:hypothetical protein [Selenomonadales bacterium]
MINLRQQGNGFMSWTFLKTARAMQEWLDYGDKFTQMGLFDFLIPDDTGRIVGTVPHADLDRVTRWPNTRYLLTVRNDGILSRFRAIVNNANGAQDKFISELHRILDAHPYAAGVDIDLEVGPNDNLDGVVSLAKRIYESIKSRPAQRFVHWDLPPMTGDGVPFWERWCDYRRMEPYFDSCAIMSYAFAWAGSAPGPISPMWWLEQVYDYAVTRIPREKIYFGIVGFGFNWRIDRAPTGYRGASGTFLAFLGWQQGHFNHHAAQPLIPFAGYHDQESQSPYLLLHVYDKLEGADTTNTLSPAVRVAGAVGNTKRNYLVAYEKSPVYDFSGVIVDRDGVSYDEISGAMSIGAPWISPRAPRLVGTPPVLEAEGLATYAFEVPAGGTYELVVRVNAPWFNSQQLQLALNGVALQVGPFPDWYPLHRRTHWISLGNHAMQPGENVLEVHGSGSQRGTQFWGFRICSSFTMRMDGGGGTYTLTPRRFKDVSGNWVLPANFILTPEVLRHTPEHAWVWYDDFRADTGGYYVQNGGVWSIDQDPKRRVMVQSDALSPDAQAHLTYYGFGDLNIRVRLRMTQGNGTMGIVFKAQGVNDLYLFLLRRSTHTAELWQRTGGTWARLQPDVAQSVALHALYTLQIRTRGSELRCWVGSTMVFSVSLSLPASGGFGIRTSNAACECSLLDAGSPYVYVPQEAIDVTLPDGQTVTHGRIARTGVTWLDPWGYFEYTGPNEERDTRTTSIPLDCDYFHTSPFAAFEDDRSVTIKLRDRGVWLTDVYLGDALGFSVAHYSDAEHFAVLKNLAKHRWGLKGVAFWALGLQDPRVFDVV